MEYPPKVLQINIVEMKVGQIKWIEHVFNHFFKSPYFFCLGSHIDAFTTIEQPLTIFKNLEAS